MISFIITSKNEPYLQQTIDDLKSHMFYDNEILSEEDDGRGQRAMINKLVKQAKHDIICKVDAHCAFGPNFDKHLLDDLDKKTVIAPVVYPLDGQTWSINHHNPMAYFYIKDFVMFHGEAPEGDIIETECMQGSFFMCYKDFFFNANLCDESLGSWGGQAVELGIQTRLHGGHCLISRKTYYAHMFRHLETDFPYQRNKDEIDQTQKRLKEKYRGVDNRKYMIQFTK